MSKPKIRYGTHEWLKERKSQVIKQEAMLNYKDKVKIYLSMTIKELKENNHPIYKTINRVYPDIDENLTLDDARLTKLFDSAIGLGSIKALEMLYKLDGSMSDLSSEPDYDHIAKETEGIE